MHGENYNVNIFSSKRNDISEHILIIFFIIFLLSCVINFQQVTGDTSPTKTTCISKLDSTYSAWGSPMVAPPNTIDFSNLQLKLLELVQNMPVFATVIALIFIYILMLVWALWRDRRDKEKVQ